MRTFSHYFWEYRTTEARRLWNNPDVFGDGPEQPQSSERQETTDVTVAPEGIRVRIDTAEEMETSVQDEAIGRMEQGARETEREEDLWTKMNREMAILLESIKGLSSEEQGARVRAFNEQILHPLGHHLHLIDGKARISAYTPKDPRMAIYRAKIAELTAEISRTTTAINQARIHGIAPMAREYRGYKRGLIRRGNIAPEISRFMMQFPVAGASALAPDLKKMYEHLGKKQMELAQLKQAGWQSMPLPAPSSSPADSAPIREESAPRFQRRVPVYRLEFSRGISTLDPELQRLARSLPPEFQRAIESVIDSMSEQEQEDLLSIIEKFNSIDLRWWDCATKTTITNPDGTFRTIDEIRREAKEHPEEQENVEKNIILIESLNPSEKKTIERLLKQMILIEKGVKKQDVISAEQIARYTDAWMKAKEKGDESGMEIAEGLLLMQGMEIDEKGKLTPLEEGFGGKGMGFIMGLIMVVDGFLKKIGEKMERKKKKEEKKDEAPIEEMTEQKKTEEIKKSEKRIGELKKEQTNLKDQIKKGEEELLKGDVETNPSVQRKLDELKKSLKKVEEELAKEEKKLEVLKKVVPTATAEGKDSEKTDPILTNFVTSKMKFVQEFQKDFEEKIQKMKLPDEVVKPMRESLKAYNEVMIKHLSIEKNADGKYRIVFDVPSMATEARSIPVLKDFTINDEDRSNMLTMMKKGFPSLEMHVENEKILSNWVGADVIKAFEL